jgi:protein-S-isoprenylcysteine O-methyltransferase Ste14
VAFGHFLATLVYCSKIDYLGEIIQSIAISLPHLIAIQGNIRYITLLYPLYYTVLFIGREREDNELCKKKYGKLWDKYCHSVPYRIFPFIY